jgi:hypothetical protein
MSTLADLIKRAEAGNVKPLAAFLKDKPMSPSGFIKTDQGSFGDGYMSDQSWLEVDSAVMEGEMSQATYRALRAAVGR